MLPASLLAFTLVAIEGITPCPTPAEVTRALERLDGPRAQGEPLVARLRDAGPALELELWRPGAVLVGRRTFQKQTPCSEMARTLALALAFWERELVGPASLAVNLPAETDEAGATGRPPTGWRFDLGGSFTASVGPAGTALGGSFETVAGPRRLGLGARLALVGQAPRELQVGDGQGRWQRVAVAPALNYRWLPGQFLIDVHVEPILSALQLSGRRFMVNLSAWTFDPGVGGGLRVGRRFGPVVPFVGLQVWGWPQPQTLTTRRQGGPEAGLPRVEGLFQAGLSVGSF